jgi:hypothetical protein
MAFLSAWSEAVNVDNIKSGFAAAGICPLSMVKPLASHFVNLTIWDGRHTRSSGRMATSDESLAQLATKPSILGEPNLPLDKQWAILLYCYDPSGIFWSVTILGYLRRPIGANMTACETHFATGRTPLLVGTTSALAGIELGTSFDNLPQNATRCEEISSDGWQHILFYTFGI